MGKGAQRERERTRQITAQEALSLMLLVLNTGNEVYKLRKEVASKAEKSKKRNSLLEPPYGNLSYWHLGFTQRGLCWTSNSLNCKAMNLCSLKP